MCISSDAANIEFDLLRFVAERASMGEHKERLFALEIPDTAGNFSAVYAAVQVVQTTPPAQMQAACSIRSTVRSFPPGSLAAPSDYRSGFKTE